MNTFRSRFWGISVILLLVSSFGIAGETTAKKRKRSAEPMRISVTPWGPTQASIDAAIDRAENSAPVQALLKGTKHRLLEFNYVENEDKSRASQPPTHFLAVFYDYTNDRTVVAEGDFAGKDQILVREQYYNPVPNDEELNEAISIVKLDSRFAGQIRDGKLATFEPMPPMTITEGAKERLVNVGLRGINGGQNEVVSVSIKRGEVIRYETKAPPASRAELGSCGPSSAGQSTTSEGTAGQHQLTVTQGPTTLWEMLVIRPSASSGTRKSGIEIRDVKYKGKSVLKRGHVPILNVQYTPTTCGPYRDWQWQEGMFATPAAGNTDPAPGIRIVAPGQVASTVLENGTDTGNFRGVAIYQQDVGNGLETVLITELNAGWYRYIMEWRFAPDGTIRPRYGFGATNNSCVCDVHNHHAYWRFDFDVVNPSNKVFQLQRGRKFQTPITTEMSGNKNNATRRSLLIQNSTGDEAYELVPNITDGLVDSFGVNDFWVLRYKSVIGGTPVQNEIDDGETCVNCNNSTAPARITPFINGESVVGEDVVVWYGAHFIHADGANLIDPDRTPEVLGSYHVVGPDLRPVRW
jgi:hypothetical protein